MNLFAGLDRAPGVLHSEPELVRWADAAVAMGPGEAAAAWRDRGGGGAYGCFPVHLVRELVWAAGLLPLDFDGARGHVPIERSGAYLQSFVCSVARSSLELGLRGSLDGIAGLVFPSTCDVARNLAGIWEEALPDVPIFYMHLPQRTGPEAVTFLAGELARFRDHLAAVCAATIPDERIEQAITRYDTSRCLMSKLYEKRARNPGALGATAIGAIVRAGGRLDALEHQALLSAAIDHVKRAEPARRQGVKVMVEGLFCEPPPEILLGALDAAGCWVVQDDIALGARWARVASSGEAPLLRLAKAYVGDTRGAAVRADPTGKRIAALLRQCRALEVDGVLLTTAKFCEPALLDQPRIARALAEAGIPHAIIEFGESMASAQGILDQVEAFVESVLLFGATA